MNVQKISDSVFYVGVNDRLTHHFEGMWELPDGVSYNSYIVQGDDAVALIDTVAVAHMSELLDNIERMCDAPRYLVVNHMEPDHSAAIPAIVARYPELKIVADKIAISMIKGFYHLEDDNLYIEVGDGSTLDLGGGKVLSFHTTPMVHWPETMMTYLACESILFSGDAFGTFGALKGNVLDDDDDTFCRYEENMRRYYASIVGKYSPFVQKAFAKLKGVDLKYLCTTHGPVWHRHLLKVVELYDTMSAQRCDDGVVMVYGSMYGNTAAMINRFATLLAERGVKVANIFNAGETEMSFILAQAWRYRGLVVASPTYSMDIFPPVEAFIKALEIRGIKNRVCVALGSYAWAPKVAAEKIESRLSALGLNVVGKVAMPMSLNADTEAGLAATADAFCAALK